VTDQSLRFTRVLLQNDVPISATGYIRGLNERWENRSCSNNLAYADTRSRAHIQNRDLNYHFEIEPATCTYTASRVNEYGSPVWAKPGKHEPAKPSGKTVHNYIETVDTGERRELFGYAARHVITKTRQIRDSEILSESESVGWYIDLPAAWAKLHPPPKPGSYCYITSETDARDEYKFSEVGKRETGFAILSSRTHRSACRDETVYREEVTEFSEAPLEPDVFVPPPDFKRVPRLLDGQRCPLAYRARLRWEMLKDSISLPNRIAKFTACSHHAS
jgi:hypothetical protein